MDKSRALWKKWIVLKTVFKIPKKLDQHNATEKINSSKITGDCPSPLAITTLDRKM